MMAASAKSAAWLRSREIDAIVAELAARGLRIRTRVDRFDHVGLGTQAADWPIQCRRRYPRVAGRLALRVNSKAR
jgi:hypothetical protein